MERRPIQFGHVEGWIDDPLPEEIAPPEDNPFGPGMRWAVRLAGSATRISEPALWPREFNFNPMLIYLTGRRRDRWMEDAMGFVPWVVLSFAEAIAAFGAFDVTQFGALLGVLAIGPLLLAPFVGLLSMRVVARGLDQSFHSVSFDQIVMSRLGADQILHGLVIRPLAIQTLGCLLNAALWIPHLLVASMRSSETVAAFLYQIAAGFLLLLLRWTLFTSCAMEGAALAARALCFIQSPSQAFLRTWLDWMKRMLIPMAVLVAMLALTRLFFMLAPLLVVACLLILAYYVRLGFNAEEVLRWVGRYSDFWWMVSGEEGAFTPSLGGTGWRSPDPEFRDVPQP